MMRYMNKKEMNYQKIGNRVRSCRIALSGRYGACGGPDGSQMVLIDENPDNVPFTQSMLLDFLRQMGRPTFGRNTLSKLENGDAAALNGVSLAQWFALCDVFGVSLGWLLGEYDDCDTIDKQWIHDRTGLTNEAITMLMDRLQAAGDPDRAYNWARNDLKAINDLLACDMWLHERVLQYIAEYNVYRFRYETDKTDAHRKDMDLAYFMALDGFGDLVKNMLYK